MSTTVDSIKSSSCREDLSFDFPNNHPRYLLINRNNAAHIDESAQVVATNALLFMRQAFSDSKGWLIKKRDRSIEEDQSVEEPGNLKNCKTVLDLRNRELINYKSEIPRDYTGFATFIYPDQGVYVGEWQSGERHGGGRITYPNGGFYEGQWYMDLPHGEGKLQFADGSHYEGEFRNGEYHGEGVFVSSKGFTYVGEFQQGLRHGFGRDVHPNNYFYEGEWIKDKPQKNGMLICSEMQVFRNLFQTSDL